MSKKESVVDQFYAERLYSYEMLTDIFAKSGYQKLTFHDVLESNSLRNQDLGMMERRIILTAKVIKQWTPLKTKSPEEKNVLVLMGDPSRPDIVKPSNIFDDDDFITIDKMKTALSCFSRETGFHI